MDRKLRCIEPRYLVLLITSVLFLPLRDSFQTAAVGGGRRLQSTRRCSSMRQQHQQQLPLRSAGNTPVPTRRLPGLLRPLKGSEDERDISGNDEQIAGGDDSIKVVDEPSAIAAAAAAAGGPAGTTGEEGEGEAPKKGEVRDCQHPKMQEIGAGRIRTPQRNALVRRYGQYHPPCRCR